MKSKGVTAFVVLIGLLLVSTFSFTQSNPSDSKAKKPLATWVGLGPDKWGSIWFMQKFVNEGQRIVMLPEGYESGEYRFFDVPGAPHFRTTSQSSFARLAKANSNNDPIVSLMSKVIHDIEINTWLPDSEAVSFSVESAYRSLQKKYDREQVPYPCYIEFFDNVFEFLSKDLTVKQIDSSYLLPSESCGDFELAANDRSKVLVPEIPIPNLFDAMRAGEKVTFVDVREPSEFKEFHIPSAVNIQIRNLDSTDLSDLKRSDIVVAYCVKDFRGFEMARKLKLKGVENAVILNPFGLKGWISNGLPVSSLSEPRDENVLAEDEALKILKHCVYRNSKCQAAL